MKPNYGNPILEYWAAIEADEIRVSAKCREMYRRLVEDIREPREPWLYSEERANHALFFIERFCRHSKGKWGGQPLRLELWEKAFVAAAFGFVDVRTDTRRFRECVLVVGRKNGKSTLAACIGLYLMIADKEAGAEIYNAATKQDQAKLIWEEARRMVQKSPALLKRIKPLVAQMVGRDGYEGCLMKPLGADSKTLDGLNVHGATLDEIHAWPGMDLYNVIVDGETAREQPMTLITTTAGTIRNGLYDEKYAEISQMLSGPRNANDRLLAVVYELDGSEEVNDPANWQKANPGLGTIKNLDALADKVKKAQINPRLMPNLLCKDFDVISTEDDAWLTFEQIDNPARIDMEQMRGCYAIGGVDLSATTDLTCATLIWRRSWDDPTVYVQQHYFLPEKRVEELEADGLEREAPYRVWEQRGLITLCPGNQVDFRAVTAWFETMRDEAGIYPVWIAFDRALAGYWMEDMHDHGFTWVGQPHPGNVLVRIPQGPFTWSQPMKQMGAEISLKHVNYDNNPITKWCLSNTRAKSKNSDGIETIEPKKLHRQMRIDGMVALLNAWVIYNRDYTDYMAYVPEHREAS